MDLEKTTFFHLDDVEKVSVAKILREVYYSLEEKGYNPLSYRLLCLQSHYRKQLVFTYENLDNAEQAYKKLKQKTLSLKAGSNINTELFESYNEKFKACINDDMNTSSAITVLYDVLKDDVLNDGTKKSLIESFDKVLSLDLLTEEQNDVSDDLAKYVEEQIKLRIEAKKSKDFETADKIRNDLLEKGVELKDTREGTLWNKIK